MSGPDVPAAPRLERQRSVDSTIQWHLETRGNARPFGRFHYVKVQALPHPAKLGADRPPARHIVHVHGAGLPIEFLTDAGNAQLFDVAEIPDSFEDTEQLVIVKAIAAGTMCWTDEADVFPQSKRGRANAEDSGGFSDGEKPRRKGWIGIFSRPLWPREWAVPRGCGFRLYLTTFGRHHAR
jgi:hypothetical protein